MGLMRICLAMVSRRRRKAAEGLLAMERWWRLPGDRARFGLGRPGRPALLLGSLWRGRAAAAANPAQGAGPPQLRSSPGPISLAEMSLEEKLEAMELL